MAIRAEPQAQPENEAVIYKWLHIQWMKQIKLGNSQVSLRKDLGVKYCRIEIGIMVLYGQFLAWAWSKIWLQRIILWGLSHLVFGMAAQSFQSFSWWYQFTIIPRANFPEFAQMEWWPLHGITSLEALHHWCGFMPLSIVIVGSKAMQVLAQHLSEELFPCLYDAIREVIHQVPHLTWTAHQFKCMRISHSAGVIKLTLNNAEDDVQSLCFVMAAFDNHIIFHCPCHYMCSGPGRLLELLMTIWRGFCEWNVNWCILYD